MSRDDRLFLVTLLAYAFAGFLGGIAAAVLFLCQC